MSVLSKFGWPKITETNLIRKHRSGHLWDPDISHVSDHEGYGGEPVEGEHEDEEAAEAGQRVWQAGQVVVVDVQGLQAARTDSILFIGLFNSVGYQIVT